MYQISFFTFLAMMGLMWIVGEFEVEKENQSTWTGDDD